MRHTDFAATGQHRKPTTLPGKDTGHKADAEERRKNLSVNEFGEQQTYRKDPIICSYCGPGTTDQLEIIDRKRTRTHLKCSECGLDWVTRKGINDKRSNL